MQVTQIYDLINTITGEMLGADAIVQEDLSNIADIGTQIFDATSVDNYVKTLVNHIGKMIFVARKYSGRLPKLVRDAWEYGSVLEKVSAALPEATENESWELQDGRSYDPNVFYKPSVVAKFFNNKRTFEIPVSFTELQVKQSFSNATQLNAFISMIYTAVENAMTLKIDGFVMRTVNNMIAETLYDEFPGGTYTTSGVKAVNLLALYNAGPNAGNTPITATAALTDKEFIRFAVKTMGDYMDRMATFSTLFNVGGTEKFTPADKLEVVLLSEFKNAAGVYLQSDTYHDQYTALPNADTVAYWQGSGTDFAFSNTSKLDVLTASGHAVALSGIIGIMFDMDSCGIANLDRRVTSNYNPKAEFYTNYNKFDCGNWNDLNENFVVFFVA